MSPGQDKTRVCGYIHIKRHTNLIYYSPKQVPIMMDREYKHYVKESMFQESWFHLCPKLCRNCVFPQNFHIRKLGEITVFYVVIYRDNQGPLTELCSVPVFISLQQEFCQRTNLIHEQLPETSKCMDSEVKKHRKTYVK